MTEAARAFALVFLAFGGTAVWLAVSAWRAEPTSGARLVAALRLAQFAALLLVLASAVPIGFAVAHGDAAGSGLVVAAATAFFATAAVTTTWEPVRALTALAIAWAAHALVDLAHAAALLPPTVVPAWYPTAGAIYDVCLAALCCLPLLRR